MRKTLGRMFNIGTLKVIDYGEEVHRFRVLGDRAI